MISFENVDKRLVDFSLKNITFDIPSGYICALAGRNGSGKSSLLNLTSGIIFPDEGKVCIDGCFTDENEKIIHEKIGFVTSKDIFNDYESLKTNAYRYGSFFKGFDSSILYEYFEKFELNDRVQYRKLSRGKKIMFELSFALSHNPQILLLDEPLSNFDPKFKDILFEIIRGFIKDSSKSVILSSHQTEDLDKTADYLLFMDKGKLVYGGDMEEFRDTYKIITAESYKIKNLPKDKVISFREGKYSSKALVYGLGDFGMDSSLSVTSPSIEEFMYLYTEDEKG